MTPRPLLLALVLATAAFCLAAGPAAAGSKYGTPRTGAWSVDSSFDDTKGGTMQLSKKKKVTKLVALTGEDADDACGTRVELVSEPKLKSYKSVSERWALAGLKKGLFVPTPVRYEVDGKRVSGKIKLLFNSPKLASPAQITFGGCTLNFTLRAK